MLRKILREQPLIEDFIFLKDSYVYKRNKKYKRYKKKKEI